MIQLNLLDGGDYGAVQASLEEIRRLENWSYHHAEEGTPEAALYDEATKAYWRLELKLFDKEQAR